MPSRKVLTLMLVSMIQFASAQTLQSPATGQTGGSDAQGGNGNRAAAAFNQNTSRSNNGRAADAFNQNTSRSNRGGRSAQSQSMTALVDVDGDARTDAVLVDLDGNGQVDRIFLSGAGATTGAGNVAARGPDGAGNANRLPVPDLDGDGRPELAVLTGSDAAALAGMESVLARLRQEIKDGRPGTPESLVATGWLTPAVLAGAPLSHVVAGGPGGNNPAPPPGTGAGSGKSPGIRWLLSSSRWRQQSDFPGGG
ncbi:MAG: hypothetical protein KDI31_00590 [Pseudomonadales bacterium]|nr:hypothetical protein [Pseudomonadales bacterium]